MAWGSRNTGHTTHRAQITAAPFRRTHTEPAQTHVAMSRDQTAGDAKRDFTPVAPTNRWHAHILGGAPRCKAVFSIDLEVVGQILKVGSGCIARERAPRGVREHAP